MFHPEKRQDFMLDNQEAKTLFMQSGGSKTDRSIIDGSMIDSPITGLGNTKTPSYGPNHFNHIQESMGGSSAYSRSKPAVVFMFSGSPRNSLIVARDLCTRTLSFFTRE